MGVSRSSLSSAWEEATQKTCCAIVSGNELAGVAFVTASMKVTGST